VNGEDERLRTYFHRIFAFAHLQSPLDYKAGEFRRTCCEAAGVSKIYAESAIREQNCTLRKELLHSTLSPWSGVHSLSLHSLARASGARLRDSCLRDSRFSFFAFTQECRSLLSIRHCPDSSALTDLPLAILPVAILLRCFPSPMTSLFQKDDVV
jgi:hypothetical protein